MSWQQSSKLPGFPHQTAITQVTRTTPSNTYLSLLARLRGWPSSLGQELSDRVCRVHVCVCEAMLKRIAVYQTFV